MEIQNLLKDHEVYQGRMDELMAAIERKLAEIPYIDKLMEMMPLTESGCLYTVLYSGK